MKYSAIKSRNFRFHYGVCILEKDVRKCWIVIEKQQSASGAVAQFYVGIFM